MAAPWTRAAAFSEPPPLDLAVRVGDDLRDDAELPELLKATTDFGEGDKKKAGGNLMFRTAWTRVPEVQLELFVAALDDYEREHGDSTGFVRMLCEKRLP